MMLGIGVIVLIVIVIGIVAAIYSR